MADIKKDLFFRDRVFTDAKSLFQHRQKSLKEIKDSALVGIDANVLLMPYQLEGVSLAEVTRIYSTLNKQERLIIPGQSVREFISHRAEKLATIVKHLRDEASKLITPLTKKVGILDSHQTFKQAKETSREIGKLCKALQTQLHDMADELTLRVGDDPVSNAYSGLTASVRDLVLDDSGKTEFLNELEWRKANKVPPGYADDGTGDLLIWKTLLSEGKAQHKDLIFVTAEEKPDWWVRSHGTFQPRVELLEEYRAFTGGHSFHLLPLSKLLGLFEVDHTILTAVRTVEEANTAAADVRAGVIDNEYQLFEVAPTRQQLLELRAGAVREAATTEAQIRNWTQDMGWLPPDQVPRHVEDLRLRWRDLRTKITLIDLQLGLPPHETSGE